MGMDNCFCDIKSLVRLKEHKKRAALDTGSKELWALSVEARGSQWLLKTLLGHRDCDLSTYGVTIYMIYLK